MQAMTTEQEMSLAELADEINQLIAHFLPFREVISFALVSKRFYELIMSNSFWSGCLKNGYLEAECLKTNYQAYGENQPNSAFMIFKDFPQLRIHYLYIGKAGQVYLEQCIKEAAKNNKLNEQQQDYLRSNPVVQQITQGKLTLKLAIEHSKVNTQMNFHWVTTAGLFGSKLRNSQFLYGDIDEIQLTPQPNVKPRTKRRI